jgi:uncharacterized protein
MTRPPRPRRIGFVPDITYFKPAGIPLRFMEEVSVSMEEVEALRLKDLESLDQEASAVKMNISRPTFQRVLASARQKIADALLNGKAIRIEGGNFEIAALRLRCVNGHEWNLPPEAMANTPLQLCPTCNMQNIVNYSNHHLVQAHRGRHRRGRYHRVITGELESE